jgi:hypothetical protein
MKYAYADDGHTRKTVMRDAHAPEQVFVKTETRDRRVVEHNTRVRNAGLALAGMRNALIPGDVIEVAFQFPSHADLGMVQAAEPDLFAAIQTGGEDGARAGRRLAILYPQYVTTVPRADARRSNDAR